MAHINAAQLQLIQRRFNQAAGTSLPEDGQMSAALHEAYVGWATMNTDARLGCQFPAWVEGVPPNLASQEELAELADKEPVEVEASGDDDDDGDDAGGDGSEGNSTEVSEVVAAAISDEVSAAAADTVVTTVVVGDASPAADELDMVVDMVAAGSVSTDGAAQPATEAPASNAWFKPGKNKSKKDAAS